MTPEGKVKQQVSKLLKSYKNLYYFMPVPSGYGESSLDYLICFRGRFISVETKRPGKKPTDRQARTISQMDDAGGKTFVVDGPDTLVFLKDYLDGLELEPAS